MLNFTLIYTQAHMIFIYGLNNGCVNSCSSALESLVKQC